MWSVTQLNDKWQTFSYIAYQVLMKFSVKEDKGEMFWKIHHDVSFDGKHSLFSILQFQSRNLGLLNLMSSYESNQHMVHLGWPWINTTDPSSVSIEEYREWYGHYSSTMGPNITDCSLEEEMNKVQSLWAVAVLQVGQLLFQCHALSVHVSYSLPNYFQSSKPTSLFWPDHTRPWVQLRETRHNIYFSKWFGDSENPSVDLWGNWIGMKCNLLWSVYCGWSCLNSAVVVKLHVIQSDSSAGNTW